MNATEIRELLRVRPFRPVRIHLSDGRTFEVRHPEQALISHSTMYIGIGEDQEYNVADKIERISLLHVTGVTETEQPPARHSN
ncbi:MAG: hypothetical protein WBC44_04685 [Planctomycetaceae bacterium]